MQLIQGTVSGKIGETTIKVFVYGFKYFSKYGKKIKTVKKYLVHNNDLEIKEGDTVLFADCRPISKRKRHIVKQIIK